MNIWNEGNCYFRSHSNSNLPFHVHEVVWLSSLSYLCLLHQTAHRGYPIHSLLCSWRVVGWDNRRLLQGLQAHSSKLKESQCSRLPKVMGVEWKTSRSQILYYWVALIKPDQYKKCNRLFSTTNDLKFKFLFFMKRLDCLKSMECRDRQITNLATV
jgi:hypothetical protein